jgi:hypothetical protein
MTTEVGDGWKYFEGKSKYPGKCAMCGLIVDYDVFYKGPWKMHRGCHTIWVNQGMVPLPEPVKPSESAANALSSASAPKVDTSIAMGLDDVVAALFDVSRAIREQTAFLREHPTINTVEVK